MKSILVLTGIVFFALGDSIAQTHPKTQRPYILDIEMLSGEKKRGVFYKVDSVELQLLPGSNRNFQFFRRQRSTDRSGLWIVTPEQVKSFSISRKGATGSAIGFGALVGLTAGSVIGAISTHKTTCPPNGNLCRSLNGLEKLSNSAQGLIIGMGVGAVAGLIIGEGKKKKFVINGERIKFFQVIPTIAGMAGQR